MNRRLSPTLNDSTVKLSRSRRSVLVSVHGSSPRAFASAPSQTSPLTMQMPFRIVRFTARGTSGAATTVAAPPISSASNATTATYSTDAWPREGLRCMPLLGPEPRKLAPRPDVRVVDHRGGGQPRAHGTKTDPPGPRTCMGQNVDAVVAAYVTTRHRILGMAEARALDVSARQVERRVDGERWTVLHRGV